MTADSKNIFEAGEYDEIELVFSDNTQTELVFGNSSSLHSEYTLHSEVDDQESWKILVVDDDAEIHIMTKLALQGFTFEDKPLTLISAYSGGEAKELIEAHPDTALMLLDVVMEEKNSGLEVVMYVREVLQNQLVRIILRTGQPGEAPEESIIVDYSINDYKVKTELTHQKLFTAMVTALRSYKDVKTIETNRKRLEMQAKQLQREAVERERVDQLKDEFLANTSHELRTPIHGIIGIAESLLDGVAGTLNLAQIENLSMIVSSGQRLERLINDILDFSKLKHEALTLHIKPTYLFSLADVVLTLARPLLNAKPIQLINTIPRNIPPVYGDENRIQQILLNLVNNAIKFTESGVIKVSAVIEGAYLHISVSDTGIGIPPDKLDSIFEAFEQADGSIERVYGGTGLGLSVSRQLVELHGGKIWIEATPEQGAKFTFSLLISEQSPEETPIVQPLVDEEEKTIPTFLVSETLPNKKTSLSPNKGEFNILIVDDEPVNRQVLTNYLSLQNYHIQTAANGAEALDLLKEGYIFDLIVLDVMMPRLSGYDVCRKIRQHHPATELPIIMLTAKTRITDLVAGFEVGANDYLTKPFSKTELLVRIKNHLQLSNLRKLNISKDKFLSIISHDLRTPFISLLNNIELILMELKTEKLDTFYEIAHDIHTAAKATYNLLENLLTWSRLERGHMTYRPRKINLNELTQNTLFLLKETASQKDIQTINNIPSNILIFADEAMIDTVIRNLVSNALKFTPEGGCVTVFAGWDMIDDKEGSEHDSKLIQISVSDTGVGIAPEDIDNLFKIDTYHVTRGTKQEQGSGLGLLICKEMVEKNGGKIWIESKIGKKTVVHFTVPLDSTSSIVPLIYEQAERLDQDDNLTNGNIEEQATNDNKKSEQQLETLLMNLLSFDEIESLFHLALKGNMQEIHQYAIYIEQLNENLKPFTNRVKRLSKRFDEEELLTLVEHYYNKLKEHK